MLGKGLSSVAAAAARATAQAAVRATAKGAVRVAGAGLKAAPRLVYKGIVKPMAQGGKNAIKDAFKETLKDMVFNPANRQRLINAILGGGAQIVLGAPNDNGEQEIMIIEGVGGVAPAGGPGLPLGDRFPAPCSCKQHPTHRSAQGEQYRIYECDLCDEKGARALELQRALEGIPLGGVPQDQLAEAVREGFFQLKAQQRFPRRAQAAAADALEGAAGAVNNDAAAGAGGNNEIPRGGLAEERANRRAGEGVGLGWLSAQGQIARYRDAVGRAVGAHAPPPPAVRGGIIGGGVAAAAFQRRKSRRIVRRHRSSRRASSGYKGSRKASRK
jgi:hypothetical protein